MASKMLILACSLRYALCPMPNDSEMKLIADLPAILVPESKKKWREFENSLEKTGINLGQDQQILAALQRVFAFSNFVAQNCIRDPSLISALIESGDPSTKLFPERL